MLLTNINAYYDTEGRNSIVTVSRLTYWATYK